MSFGLYLLGAAIFIGGVAWALIAAHVPQHYVIIAGVILLGVAIFTGVTRTRSKDPSKRSSGTIDAPSPRAVRARSTPSTREPASRIEGAERR